MTEKLILPLVFLWFLGAADAVVTTRPNDQDSVPGLPTIPLNSSAGASTAIGEDRKDLQIDVVTYHLLLDILVGGRNVGVGFLRHT